MQAPDHQKLWRDAIYDAAPKSFVEATLAFTIAHARRERRTRRNIRIAAGATVSLVAALGSALLYRSTYKAAPSESARSVVVQAAQPTGVSVHYLTDDEVLALFPNQPVGLVGSGSSRELL